MLAEGATAARTPRWFVPALIVAVALTVGIFELPMALLRRYLFALPIEGNAHIMWMAALTNLILLAPVGVLLWLIAWRWPVVRSERIAAIVFFGLAALALLLYIPRVHLPALSFLAAGLGVVAADVAMRYRKSFHSAVRRLALLLPSLLLLEGLSAAAWTGLHERNAMRGLPAAAAGSPNVLLLVLDTVRSISLSLYGYALRTTPFLEEWAAQSTVFDHAIATSTWTLPSHAGIFTGRYPFELNAGFKTPLDDAQPTLAEVLARHGYSTAAFSANRKYVSYEHGLNRGFARFEDFHVSPGQIAVSAALGRQIIWRPWFQDWLGYYDLYGRKNAEQVNASLLSWLRKRPTQRPFFAFANFYDAHDPYLPPPPFAQRFTRDTTRFRPLGLAQKMSPAEIERERAAYEGAISYIDAQLKSLLTELESRGVLENTIVIIASDHGEQFGEHGLMDHGNSLYRVLQEVPLIVHWPRHVPAGVRVAAPVTLRDLAATIIDLTAVKDSLPGTSLAGYWENGAQPGTTTSPLLAQVTWPNGQISHSVRAAGHEYISWFDEPEKLFDLEKDPGENANLLSGADSTTLATPFRDMRDRMFGGRERANEVRGIARKLTRLIP